MDCKTCEELISESLDTKTGIPSDVKEHVALCVTCSAFLEGVNRIDAQLRREIADGTSRVSGRFHDRLMAKIEGEPAANFPEPKKIHWLAYAAAAVLTLAILGLLLSMALGPATPNGGETIVDDPMPTPNSEVVEALIPPTDLNEQIAVFDSLLAEKTEGVYHAEVDNIKDDISQAAGYVLANFR